MNAPNGSLLKNRKNITSPKSCLATNANWCSSLKRKLMSGCPVVIADAHNGLGAKVIEEAGSYTFYFAVDYPMNGVLDLEQIYADSVTVNIQ